MNTEKFEIVAKTFQGLEDVLAEELKNVELHDVKVPYLTNVTADYVTDPSQVKELLKKQISSSVRWQQRSTFCRVYTVPVCSPVDRHRF